MKKLLAYDYKGVKHGGGVYDPKEVNLGDYIQTLAAKRFYDVFSPKKKYEELDLIDRDSLLSAENSDFIANGWYVLSDENHLWPDSADPLLVSIHIRNREGFPRVLEKLKDSSHKRPIGCRDLATLNFLKGEGVEAYFSSCLTTTLQREDWTDKKDEERSGVVFSDVAPKMMTYSPLISRGVFKQLKPSLKYNFLNFCYRLLNDRCDLSLYENEDVRLVTHEMTKESTHADRFREAEKLLKTFAEARLVITSRIHCIAVFSSGNSGDIDCYL